VAEFNPKPPEVRGSTQAVLHDNNDTACTTILIRVRLAPGTVSDPEQNRWNRSQTAHERIVSAWNGTFRSVSLTNVKPLKSGLAVILILPSHVFFS